METLLKRKDQIDDDKRKRLRLWVLGILVSALVIWQGYLSCVASKFDWRQEDASEIEISVYPDSPNEAESPITILVINDQDIIGEVFDGLCDREEYKPQHQHPIGKWYVIKLRRKSDNAWSKYFVRVYPSAKELNGPVKTDVYLVHYALSEESSLYRFRSKKLGMTIEKLESTVDGAPSGSPTTNSAP